MNMKKTCDRLITIFRREMRIFAHRPLFLFTMIVAPVLCVVFFTTLMSDGLPTKLPAGLVDEDNTHITHIVTRILGSMEETDLGTRYPSFTEARSAMQRGEIYGFFYIPKGLTEDAIANRQPRLSFYTNETYFVPGTLLMKDLRYVCELSGLALTRETLYGKGLTEKQAMGILQAIVIETHPLNNPYLDYSVYLNNILLPGILILLVMLCTTYTIGLEWKRGTQRELYSLSGCSSTVALVGKLLPQTVLFSLMFIFYDVYFLQVPNVPLQLRYRSDDATGRSHGVGGTSLRRVPLWCVYRSDAFIHVFVLSMGHTVVLTGGLHLSCSGNGRLTAKIVMAVPAQTLLSNICQSGFGWLFSFICLAICRGIARFFAVAMYGTMAIQSRIFEI